MVAIAAIEDLKGLNITSLELTNAYADTLIIATGTSQRHVGAIADRVQEYLHKSGLVVDNLEGTPNNNWVIVDAGDVVIHIFTEEMRSLYNIEKLYAHDFDDDEDDHTPERTGS